MEHGAQALDLLKDGVNAFVDATMARLRREVSLENHLPEAVAYIGTIVGRELPQPEQTLETPDEARDDGGDSEDEGQALRVNRASGDGPPSSSMVSDPSRR